MTSFTAHPDKPFSYFSSHFDSSIIQWSLHSIPDISLTLLKFLLNCSEAECLCEDVHQMMTQEVSARLTGTSSRKLFDQAQTKNELEKCESWLRFFIGLDG